MSDIDYGPLTPEEVNATAGNLYWAFTASPAELPAWIEKVGIDRYRVFREGGRPVGCLAFSWMGQWFGGRSVSMAGIAAVAVEPDRRGHGIGARLMAEALKEIRAAGYPLSGLYPATQPLYRSVGYEQAGSRFEIRLPAASIDVKDRELELEPAGEEDREALAACYATRARATEGNLDRNDYMWMRIWKPRGVETPRVYKVGGHSGVEGYVVMNKVIRNANAADLNVHDLVALTPRAARRLLTLFADHRSLVDNIIWYGAASDPLFTLLREQPADAVRLRYNWMLRLVDVPAALEARGYAPAARGEVHLAVNDPLFPENGGPWVFTVEDGVPRVRPGGRGSLRITIRGLAALYSGFLNGPNLRILGLLDAPDEELRAADLIFAGAPPWMPDMY